MTTFFDRAAALELQQREDALAKMKRFEFLPYTGQCYNCERSFKDTEFECKEALEPVCEQDKTPYRHGVESFEFESKQALEPKNSSDVEQDDIQRRFCDEFCRDDYDKRMAKQKTGWAKATR